MTAEVKIAVVDSGCSPAHDASVLAAAAFEMSGLQVQRTVARHDRLGHGSRIINILLARAPSVQLLVAQVFGERLCTTADQVAAAVDWAVASGAQIINLSLGLREPRPVLDTACTRAVRSGAVLCAAVPAIGPVVYPGGFAGVLRVTGDARCARDEIAALGAPHADFGAHVRPLDGSLAGAGASLACAHLSAMAACHLVAGGTCASLHDWLVTQSRYQGMEVLPGRGR